MENPITDPVALAHAAILDGKLQEAHQILQPVLQEIEDGGETIGPELTGVLQALTIADAETYGIRSN